MQPRSVLLCAICTPVARTDVPTLPDLGASACAIVHTHVTDVAIAMMPASCARAHDNGSSSRCRSTSPSASARLSRARAQRDRLGCGSRLPSHPRLAWRHSRFRILLGSLLVFAATSTGGSIGSAQSSTPPLAIALYSRRAR